MRLHAVANRFNETPCLDAYTGVFAFNGQLGLYDDNKRDSETSERRVMSVSEEASNLVPARRVISAAGTRFIVGHSNPDTYKGSVIRVGLVIHEAPELSQIRTLAQVCLGQAGSTAYAGRAWLKDLSYSQQSSKETPEHHVHFGRNEVVSTNHLITFEGRLNLVRSTNLGAGGTLVTTCEEIAEPSIESAMLMQGTYDPVSDTTLGSAISVTVVRLRWQSLFAYHSSISPKFAPGDLQVAIARSVSDVKAGATLTLSDGTWYIQSAVAEGAVWLCHATRHA